MKLLDIFLVYLFICTFDCYAATAASGTPEKQKQQRDDLRTPSTVLAYPGEPTFATPQRRLINDAAVVSPPRVDKKPWGTPSVLSAVSSLEAYDASAQTIIRDLLETQKRPFLLIRAAPSVAEVEPTAATPVADSKIKYVIITPTHTSDFEHLNYIDKRYQASSGEKIFLSRDYGDAANFAEKIAKLRTHYASITYDTPLFYQMIKGFYESDKSKNQHFGSSVTFTIIGIRSSSSGSCEKVILGDIWLSHIDSESIEVCIKGTAERSTMVDLVYQSMGIGQAAVGMLNELLVKSWVGKTVKLINPKTGDTIATTKDIIFDGIMSYVEPDNYRSIGYNYRIGNFPVGLTKEYIMFRKESAICSPKHLAIDALDVLKRTEKKDPNRLSTLLELWRQVKYLYPSQKAIADGVWIRNNATGLYEPRSAERPYDSSLSAVLRIASGGGYVPEHEAKSIEADKSFGALRQSLLGPATMPRSVAAVVNDADDAQHQGKVLMDQMVRTATDGTEDMAEEDDVDADDAAELQQMPPPAALFKDDRK